MLGDVVLNELAFANDLLSATFTVCEAKEDLSYDLRRSLDEIVTVFRCRGATVLKIILTQKFFCLLLSICNSFDRNLVVICVFGYQTLLGGKMMIDFEGWDVGYADARNGQPSQCPTNVDPISYLSGYRERCSPDRAHTSPSVQMKRGWLR